VGNWVKNSAEIQEDPISWFALINWVGDLIIKGNQVSQTGPTHRETTLAGTNDGIVPQVLFSNFKDNLLHNLTRH